MSLNDFVKRKANDSPIPKVDVVKILSFCIHLLEMTGVQSHQTANFHQSYNFGKTMETQSMTSLN